MSAFLFLSCLHVLRQGLLHRLQVLRAAGRCIILLGDLNISPAPIDSCDPGPIDAFVSRSDRRLLTRLLTANGGPFLDVFRKFHPDRCALALMCWRMIRPFDSSLLSNAA